MGHRLAHARTHQSGQDRITMLPPMMQPPSVRRMPPRMPLAYHSRMPSASQTVVRLSHARFAHGRFRDS